MNLILTKCGYRCDLCLAYKPNIKQHPADQQKLSDGWLKYFGFRMPPSEIYCDGCLADNSRLLDKNCPVRPCVIEKGLDNCAQCESYICKKLKARLITYEQIQNKIGTAIPEDDYKCFIQPYENKPRLDALRAAGKDGSVDRANDPTA